MGGKLTWQFRNTNRILSFPALSQIKHLHHPSLENKVWRWTISDVLKGSVQGEIHSFADGQLQLCTLCMLCIALVLGIL